MLQPGDALAGYRIESVAGVGGMGVVYRAVQTSLDRPVALKVLSSTLVGNRTFRERFRREGRHAAALDHPNIIPVYEAGESNGLMFIAMRLVDGPSLADLIDRGELSGREAVRIVSAIAGALDAAHDGGLVHRDIKPQNILITRTGHPYLADFGITKGSDHAGLTHSGDFVGSLNYVAPEQIEGKDVGGASDIYSLAAVLFQALSGAYPYQRESDAALMHAHLSADPPTFSARGIVAPPALDAVLARGMAKAPTDRFATAGELMRACAAALAGVDDRTLGQRPAFPAPGALPTEPTADPADITQPDQLGWVDPPAELGSASSTAAMAIPANVTTVDRPRDIAGAASTPATAAAAPAAPRERRPLPSWLAPLGIAAGAVAALAAGYLLTHEPAAPAAPPVTAQRDGDALRAALPAGWSQAPAAGKIDGRPALLTLRSASETLSAGRAPGIRGTFSPIPSDVRAQFDAPPEQLRVRLGARQWVAVTGTTKLGTQVWSGASPDDAGWLQVTCSGANATAACPAAIATLQTPGRAPRDLGPRTATITKLGAALSALSSARRAAAGGLATKSPGKRAEAATRLAAAHATAATAVRRAPDAWERRFVGGPFTDLATALEAQQTQLARLASAAKARDRARYRDARGALQQRESRVERALDRLTELGYLAG